MAPTASGAQGLGAVKAMSTDLGVKTPQKASTRVLRDPCRPDGGRWRSPPFPAPTARMSLPRALRAARGGLPPRTPALPAETLLFQLLRLPPVDARVEGPLAGARAIEDVPQAADLRGDLASTSKPHHMARTFSLSRKANQGQCICPLESAQAMSTSSQDAGQAAAAAGVPAGAGPSATAEGPAGASPACAAVAGTPVNHA